MWAFFSYESSLLVCKNMTRKEKIRDDEAAAPGEGKKKKKKRLIPASRKQRYTCGEAMYNFYRSDRLPAIASNRGPCRRYRLHRVELP